MFILFLAFPCFAHPFENEFFGHDVEVTLADEEISLRLARVNHVHLQWIWLPAILVAVFSLLLLFLIHFIMKSETGFFASIRRFVQKIITGKW